MEDDTNNNNNWDLHAIVRAAYSSKSNINHHPKPTLTLLSSSPSPLELQEQEAKINTHFSISETAPICNATTLDNRSKRRRGVAKLITNVCPKEVGSDMWSWRKYGEKSIKGSPYKRGYYRCSSSKECMARKQVEQNRMDPRMVTLIYRGEHNHPIPTLMARNSIAGTPTRRTRRPKPPPPTTTTTLSPNMVEENNSTSVEDHDAFYDGLDDLLSVDSFPKLYPL